MREREGDRAGDLGEVFVEGLEVGGVADHNLDLVCDCVLLPSTHILI